MSYAITDIILWAKISQPFARRGEYIKQSSSGKGDLDLDMKLYDTRRDLEYSFAQEPTSGTTFSIGNYLLSLMGVYLFIAQQQTVGGGSITPIVPATATFPLFITSDEFADATHYNNSNIVGFTLAIFVNEYTQQWLIAGANTFEYTATGINILIPGFSAFTNTYSILIERVNT